jgi:hypothetical protein
MQAAVVLSRSTHAHGAAVVWAQENIVELDSQVFVQV